MVIVMIPLKNAFAKVIFQYFSGFPDVHIAPFDPHRSPYVSSY